MRIKPVPLPTTPWLLLMFSLPAEQASQQVEIWWKLKRYGTVGAIAGAVIVLARRSLHDLPTLAIGVVTLILLLRWKIPEPLIILTAALLGLALYRG